MFNVQRPEVLDRNSPWVTRQADRVVLAVVHNVTAATRLFDVLPILADDPRIQVHFTCPESSPFHGQIAEYLAAHKVSLIAWPLAVETPFDLAVSASHGGALHELMSPLIVLPHGMGYNKYLPRILISGNQNSGNQKSVFGLSAEWLLHDGRVIADSLVLSHPEQLDRLRMSCPEAAEVAVVAGDPVFDRALASVPLRHLYRDALNVRGSQRLVFVSSTWGPASLYGRRPDLVHRLRAELPLDDYQVAVALHPNIWSAHSPWQIRRWLETCARSGVIVFPAEEGWRAGLVAADVVIGDYGSVTFYGASLGQPVILAEAPSGIVDPASAIGRFLGVAPRLHHADALRPQVETALANAPSGELREIAELTTATPLKSHSLLRTELYRLLNLEEPAAPAEASAVPIPVVTAGNTAAQSVHVTLEQADGRVRATVVRVPAALLLRGRPSDNDTHLVVTTDEPSETALQLADVVIHEEPGDTAEWVVRTLASLPGATVGARPSPDGSWVAGTRDGHRVHFGATAVSGVALASVALAWTAQGNPLCSLPKHIDLRLGGTSYEVEARCVFCPRQA